MVGTIYFIKPDNESNNKYDTFYKINKQCYIEFVDFGYANLTT